MRGAEQTQEAASSGADRQRAAGRALESYQVAFLEVASVQLPLELFALKGGANLRFFLRSFRRSVDMDLNYLGQPDRFEAFIGRVERVFGSLALASLLEHHHVGQQGLRIAKRTETTARWKFTVSQAGVDAPSKIEFSARPEGAHSADHELAAIDAALARRLRVRPVKVEHYLPRAAIFQKITALRARAVTQPRDVFDLDHLFREFPGTLDEVDVDVAALEAARDRTLELSYDEYASTVRPYLQEELEALFGDETAWTEMQLHVVDRLERRRGALLQ